MNTKIDTVIFDVGWVQLNVEAAHRRGWHAIQHVSPQRTMQALRELGVE